MRARVQLTGDVDIEYIYDVIGEWHKKNNNGDVNEHNDKNKYNIYICCFVFVVIIRRR